MTPELNLIDFEQLANVLFLVATGYAIASANQARQTELRKLQGVSSSGSSTAQKSAQFALTSTIFTVSAYVLFTLIAAKRKNLLEKDVLEGTSTLSLKPIILITLGFAISLLGAAIRVPALQQRVREASEVIL